MAVCTGIMSGQLSGSIQVVTNGNMAIVTICNTSSNDAEIGAVCFNTVNPGTITAQGVSQVMANANCGGNKGSGCTCFDWRLLLTPCRIKPGECRDIIMMSTIPFCENQFKGKKVGIHFQGIKPSQCLCGKFEKGFCDDITETETMTVTETQTESMTETITDTKTDTDTMTECPIPNPQTCCVHAVEFKTQLVPPALEGSFKVNDVSVEATIEAVCPEMVIVCGKVTKFYQYTTVDRFGKRSIQKGTDEVGFQCMIDRDDADEGHPSDYVITGKAVLCGGKTSVHNKSKRPDCDSPGQNVNVFWSFREKDLVKICIRKSSY